MNQHEYFGVGSIKNLKTILDEGNQRNIFLVSGGKSYKSSGAEQELSKILAPYTITRFYNFSPNPKLEDVEKGIDVFKREEQDLVIAIGGGSVIDMAKLINSLSAQSGNPENYIKGKKMEIFKVFSVLVGLMAIIILMWFITITLFEIRALLNAYLPNILELLRKINYTK